MHSKALIIEESRRKDFARNEWQRYERLAAHKRLRTIVLLSLSQTVGSILRSCFDKQVYLLGSGWIVAVKAIASRSSRSTLGTSINGS